jgi:probable nitrogen fixation protein
MYGAWDSKSNLEILSCYIVTKEQRRALPVIGDPDSKTLLKVELFYNAVGLAIEHKTNVIATPMIKLHQEGFGRVVLTAGRLVVVNKHLRDIHRFGFENIERLTAEGAKLVAAGIEWIEKYPEVANE